MDTIPVSLAGAALTSACQSIGRSGAQTSVCSQMLIHTATSLGTLVPLKVDLPIRCRVQPRVTGAAGVAKHNVDAVDGYLGAVWVSMGSSSSLKYRSHLQ